MDTLAELEKAVAAEKQAQQQVIELQVEVAKLRAQLDRQPNSSCATDLQQLTLDGSNQLSIVAKPPQTLDKARQVVKINTVVPATTRRGALTPILRWAGRFAICALLIVRWRAVLRVFGLRVGTRGSV